MVSESGKRIVICGIGNGLRADDAVGPLVIDKLQKRSNELPERIMLLDCGSTPERYAGKIIDFNPDTIILVDAVQMNRMAGEVVDVPVEKIKSMLTTTHKMPITLFIDYLQKSLPDMDVVFIGIQQASTIFGEELSDECRASVPISVGKIMSII